MDRNFIFAILMSTLIIILYASPVYQKHFGKEIPEAIEQETTTSAQRAPDNNKLKTVKPRALIASGTKSEEATESELPTTADSYTQINVPENDKIVTIHNNDISVSISTKGGAISNAVLGNFDGTEKDTPVQLVTEGESWYDGTITDNDTLLPLDSYLFAIDRITDRELFLSAELEGGRKITRSFSLADEGYKLSASTDVEGSWNDPVLSFAWHGPLNKTESSYRKLKIWPFSMMSRDNDQMFQKMVYLGDGTRSTVINGDEKRSKKRIFPKEDHSQKIDAKKSGQGTDTFVGDLEWYAVRSLYFVSIAIPHEQARWEASSQYSATDDAKWFDFTLSKRISDGNSNIDIYLGPISYTILKDYGRDLTEMLELSFRLIRPLSIGLIWLFKKLNTFIPNWGLVIIAFSFILKLVLYPLSKKSYDSMRKMSELQPQMNELKEKHKNNPQNLQRATMELYKTEGVNPFSGCLPNLLMFPFFIALYPVVGRAFELRHAMFIPHWIEDLSRPDPFFLLPIAFGVSMFFQSKQTMKDPNQKAMLYIMPVMIVFIFANFSAGLSLYWFVFNILTFVQQKLHRS